MLLPAQPIHSQGRLVVNARRLLNTPRAQAAVNPPHLHPAHHVTRPRSHRPAARASAAGCNVRGALAESGGAMVVGDIEVAPTARLLGRWPDNHQGLAYAHALAGAGCRFSMGASLTVSLAARSAAPPVLMPLPEARLRLSGHQSLHTRPEALRHNLLPFGKGSPAFEKNVWG